MSEWELLLALGRGVVNVLMFWWALGTLLRQLFPRYCDGMVARYGKGRR